MSRNSKEDFDDILEEIAKKIYGKVVVDGLGKKLGFTSAETDRYNEENTQQGVSYMGTLHMLRKWRQDQDESEQRGNLKAALEKAGLKQMANQYFSAGDLEQPPIQPPPVSTNPPRSTNNEVTEKKIVKLSKLLPDGKYSELCGILGFEYSYITKIKKKHSMDSTAAFEELLHEWNDKGGSIEDLDAALKEADLGGLAPKYKN